MIICIRKLAVLFLLTLATGVYAQSLEEGLPLNPDVKYGQLPNGLTYYVQPNQKPENRAELRLVIKAGSILETDAQQGLAHFVEHMAFNGTKNFSKNALIHFLERSGVRFGAHLNAYTSFDETVYMLSLPTDTPQVFQKGFQVLEDWAHQLAFDPEEIEKERGVILEERRSGLGAQQRIRDQVLPVLLKGSRYPDRLPIGKEEVLQHFPHEELTSFYRDWYRPDLMAVIAVGDFDPSAVVQMIKDHFARIKGPDDEKEPFVATIPDHAESLVKIVTDKESQYTQLQVYYKRPRLRIKTGRDYIESLTRSLYNTMLNNRIEEIRQQADAPFLYASSSISGFLGDKDAYSIMAVPKDKKTEEALTAVLKENLRVLKYGFTETELERGKKALLRNYQNAWSERDKRENARFVNEYVNHFLREEASPGIGFEYEFVKQHLDGIGLEHLNRLARTLITDSNRVVILTAPDSKKQELPDENRLLQILNKADSLEVEPYVDVVADQPLFSGELTPAEISDEQYLEEIGVTRLRLENGAEVFLKPTDFKNKEVLFQAYSPGGSSLYPDEDHLEASSATGILNQSGIAGFEEKVLRKMLEGKTVGVSPYIAGMQEGFTGSANIEDIETLLQLTYLYFTRPRFDDNALKTWQENQRTYIKTRYQSPENVFRDSIRQVFNNYAPRYAPHELEDINQVDFERMQEIYRDRFADAGDFAFFFAGSFEVDSLKPVIAEYLGNLPATGRKENWKDLGIYPPAGIVKKAVYKGSEPKSQVVLNFSGDAEYDPVTNAQLRALGEVLQIRLRETLREEAGGVYGVGVQTNLSRIPRERYAVQVFFGCAPENVDTLKAMVFGEMQKLKENGPQQDDLNKVKSIRKREHETAVRENGYWLDLLSDSYQQERDPVKAFRFFDASMEQLTVENLQEVARKFFDEENYIEGILYPGES